MDPSRIKDVGKKLALVNHLKEKDDVELVKVRAACLKHMSKDVGYMLI
jgi:hypothetical protein